MAISLTSCLKSRVVVSRSRSSVSLCWISGWERTVRLGKPGMALSGGGDGNGPAGPPPGKTQRSPGGVGLDRNGELLHRLVQRFLLERNPDQVLFRIVLRAPLAGLAVHDQRGAPGRGEGV